MINTNKNNDKKLIRPLYANGGRELLQKKAFHIIAASPWLFLPAQALTRVVLAIVNAFHYTKFSFDASVIKIFAYMYNCTLYIQKFSFLYNYTNRFYSNFSIKSSMQNFLVLEIIDLRYITNSPTF
jgi:hypothetical protein